MAVQTVWRGRTARITVHDKVDERRHEYRVVLRAWHHLTAANKHARLRCLEKAYFAWLLEQVRRPRPRVTLSTVCPRPP